MPVDVYGESWEPEVLQIFKKNTRVTLGHAGNGNVHTRYSLSEESSNSKLEFVYDNNLVYYYDNVMSCAYSNSI